MRYTNELHLPEAFRLAVEGPQYEPSTDRDYYVTELIGSPRIRRLKQKHEHELVEDISDHVWRVFGQSAHSVLYLASQHDKNPEHFYEQRFVHECKYSKKRTVRTSGRIDVLYADEGAIYDWKTTSVWGVKDGVRPEWIAELNFYRAMAMQNGYQINRLYAVSLLRDWSAGMSKRNPDMPQKSIQIIPVEVWDLRQTEDWIKGLIRRHEAKKMPECTPEERWQAPPVWAVMKKGRKTAVRVFHDEAEAKVKLSELGEEHYLIERKGISRRCASFCPVAEWCEQYAKEKALEAAGSDAPF